jgi:hypothetical protein
MNNLQSIMVRFALLSLALAGCKENSPIKLVGEEPVAVAWVKGFDYREDAEVQDPIELMPEGDTTVRVTLDGSRSHDDDGSIVTYRWLSATRNPDGSGRLIPGFNDEDGGVEEGATSSADEGTGYPKDVAKPVVDLPVGEWKFSLWVIDNSGLVSEPDIVTITVGEPPPPPEVLECAAGIESVVMGSVAEECARCACGISEECREAMAECTADCWGLIGCIGDNCPDFAAMAEENDFSCVTTNCGDFLGGATPAGPAGDCLTQCPDECVTD